MFQNFTFFNFSFDVFLLEIRLFHFCVKFPFLNYYYSYRPPEEFLFTEEESLQWDSEHPDDRRSNYKPVEFGNLRKVPAYENYLNERFERCLDLYLAPRQRKMKMNVNKEDLIPKLPSPKDLQPFPTFQGFSSLFFGQEILDAQICRTEIKFNIFPNVSNRNFFPKNFWISIFSEGRFLGRLKTSNTLHS